MKLETLTKYRSDIEQICKNFNVTDLLEQAENDVILKIKRDWFDKFNLSETWNVSKLDKTSLENLFAYYALFIIYRFVAKDVPNDALSKLRDYFENQFKSEFNAWFNRGFPYSFDVVGFNNFRLKRV